MKKTNSLALLEQLQADIRQMIVFASFLQHEEETILLQQPVPGSWSIAQVLEHLNSYGKYYLPAIQKVLSGNTPAAKETFMAGWLGNYFTNLMKPGSEGIKNKMRAPKDHVPVLELDATEVMSVFLQQQQHLLQLLEQAKSVNIGQLRVPISLAKLIRLKLGDTFGFLIAHEQRHFVQIENVLRELNKVSDKYPVIRLVV
jgi:uncharacterized damage-inducible protein DinB